MKIRNPFKDKWGRWKDDVSPKEKLIWSFTISFSSVALGMFVKYLIPFKKDVNMFAFFAL